MTDKALVFNVLQELPDDASIEAIYEKLDFILSVREGLEQADRDEGISLEEWQKKIGTWATKQS
jgi:hypothetical protein